MEIVHIHDMPERYGTDLLQGSLDEASTYFWSHIAYFSRAELSDVMSKLKLKLKLELELELKRELGRGRELELDGGEGMLWRSAMSCTTSSGGPSVIAFNGGPHNGAHILAVMGSKSNDDLRTILDFAFDKKSLVKRIESSYYETFRNDVPNSDLLLEVVLEYLDRLPCAARVHPGIFLRAYQTLNIVWQHLEACSPSPSSACKLWDGPIEEDTPAATKNHVTTKNPATTKNHVTKETLASTTVRQRRVVLHGHSLGAACATLTYAWLRDIYHKGGRDVFDTIDVKCSCVATPMFCDELAWREWFRGRPDASDNDVYVHYYTAGDVVVHDIPALAGYTRAFSGAHRVCPDATDHLIALAQTDDRQAARTRLMLGRDFDYKRNTVNKLLLVHSTLQVPGGGQHKPIVFVKSLRSRRVNKNTFAARSRIVPG